MMSTLESQETPLKVEHSLPRRHPATALAPTFDAPTLMDFPS